MIYTLRRAFLDQLAADLAGREDRHDAVASHRLAQHQGLAADAPAGDLDGAGRHHDDGPVRQPQLRRRQAEGRVVARAAIRARRILKARGRIFELGVCAVCFSRAGRRVALVVCS